MPTIFCQAAEPVLLHRFTCPAEPEAITGRSGDLRGRFIGWSVQSRSQLGDETTRRFIHHNLPEWLRRLGVSGPLPFLAMVNVRRLWA